MYSGGQLFWYQRNFISSISGSKLVIWSTQESKNGSFLVLKSPLLIGYWEYACQVAMEYENETEQLQKVQQFALWMCMKQWDVSYSDLLELFATPTLADRRKYLIKSLCYVCHFIATTKSIFSQTYLYPDICVHCAHHNSSNHLLNPMHSYHLYVLNGISSLLMSHFLLHCLPVTGV